MKRYLPPIDPKTGKFVTIGQEIKDEIRKSVRLYLKPSRAIADAFKESVLIPEDKPTIPDSPRSYQPRGSRVAPKSSDKKRA